jgi:hypothetical protein
MTHKEPPPTTEDGHFIVVARRRWRATDPTIPKTVATALRQALLTARRDVARAAFGPKPGTSTCTRSSGEGGARRAW